MDMTGQPSTTGADKTREVVLVTGACGFVGSALCEMLIGLGKKVVALDDLSLGHPDNWREEISRAIELEEADIRDAGEVARVLARHRPATIFHLAAIHFIPACDADPGRAIAVNVQGTQNLLSASSETGRPGVVLASTGAVYGPADTAHSEDDQLAPTDIYGLTKLWMEQAAELHHRRTGAPVGIARLFNVVGRGETNPHLVPEVIRQAMESDTLHLGNLATRRDYIHVDDVARGLIRISEVMPELGHAVCNLGAERAVDGKQLVAAIGRVMGKELSVAVDSARLRSSDRPVLESNCGRAHTLLGWRARVDLDDAMRDAVARPLADSANRTLVNV